MVEKEKRLIQFIDNVAPTYENHPDIIFIKDREILLRYVNKKYLNVNQVTKKEVIDKSNSEIFDEENAKRFEQTDTEILNRGEIIEYKINMGSEYFLVTKSPIIDEEEIIGIFGTGRNITNQVEIQMKLKDNLRMIETLINTISYPIFVKDLSGKFIQVNQAFADFHDKSIKEIIGKTDFDLLSEELAEYFRDQDKRVLESKQREIYFTEEGMVGENIITIKQILENSDGDVIGIIGIVNNLFTLDEVKNKLMSQQKIDSISNLAGGIAHDLNNILQNILGLIEIISFKDLSDETEENLLTIKNSVTNASNLIKKLLTFSTRQKHQSENMNINNIIREILSLVKANYVEIHFNIDLSEKPLFVEGDKSQITQMIMNLVINGIEAMDESGILEITTKRTELDSNTSNYAIHPGQIEQMEFVSIQIKDRGPGINDDDLMKIFEPYFSSKENKNTGLGLSIVYGVVTSHNGAIKLDTDDNGTTFEIFLPKSQMENIDGKRKSLRKNNSKEQNTRILIIDDDKNVLEVLTKILKSEDMDVIVTKNPKKGIEKFQKNKENFNLIILDLIMPEMHGIEVLNELRESDSEIPVIISSGYIEDPISEQLREFNDIRILHKPYTKKKLMDEIFTQIRE